MTDSSLRFKRALQYVLLTHREGRPLGECVPCRGGAHNWPRYRDHLIDLIDAEREQANLESRRSVNAFTEILAEHAPCNASGGGLCCNLCIDGHGSGEFKTTVDWAAHVELEIAKLDLRVTYRRGGDS